VSLSALWLILGFVGAGISLKAVPSRQPFLTNLFQSQLFLEVTAKNAAASCSTFLLPQCGHFGFS
jgi:hypothetical protein